MMGKCIEIYAARRPSVPAKLQIDQYQTINQPNGVLNSIQESEGGKNQIDVTSAFKDFCARRFVGFPRNALKSPSAGSCALIWGNWEMKEKKPISGIHIGLIGNAVARLDIGKSCIKPQGSLSHLNVFLKIYLIRKVYLQE